MAEQLLDIMMHDGSRHFGDLPQTKLWNEVRGHINELEGAMLTGFVTDYVTEGWIDFSYLGHSFSINDQFGEYWFFVKDSACPEDILQSVMSHFRLLLGKSSEVSGSEMRLSE